MFDFCMNQREESATGKYQILPTVKTASSISTSTYLATREVMEGAAQLGGTKFIHGFQSVLPVAGQPAHERRIAGQCVPIRTLIAYPAKVRHGC